MMGVTFILLFLEPLPLPAPTLDARCTTMMAVLHQVDIKSHELLVQSSGSGIFSDCVLNWLHMYLCV